MGWLHHRLNSFCFLKTSVKIIIMCFKALSFKYMFLCWGFLCGCTYYIDTVDACVEDLPRKKKSPCSTGYFKEKAKPILRDCQPPLIEWYILKLAWILLVSMLNLTNPCPRNNTGRFTIKVTIYFLHQWILFECRNWSWATPPPCIYGKSTTY